MVSGKFKYILLVSLFLFGLSLGQQVLFESELGCGADEWDYQQWFDTLESHGATVDWTQNVGYSNMDIYEMYWGQIGALPGEIRNIVVEYTRLGGHVVIWHWGAPYPNCPELCSLLIDTAWSSTIAIEDSHVFNQIDRFFSFYRLVENVEYMRVSSGLTVTCGNHAYPFIFSDTSDIDIYTDPIAAISYPFIQEGRCGSYIMLVTGTRYWDLEAGPYPGSDGWRLARNMLLTGANIPGWQLPPCAVPEPFEIEVDSVPECASPGDTITLTGCNLWQGSNENIGGDIEIYFYGPQDTVVIPFEYSDHRPDPHSLYDTWLKFICPALPDGEYDIELGHKAITFYAESITIPCDRPDYSLCHRTPNPFTPNGDGINDEAEFTFPDLGEVPGTIKIFTLGNLRVRTIEVPTGAGAKQEAIWDGTDDTGEPLSQGIYIYTIRAEGRIKCSGTVTLAR